MPSDSLLTLDLKSGGKVNIGTYAITLDKFFEGSLKVTRSFDIGNGKLLCTILACHVTVCMCLYVCMYVCVHVCMSVCTSDVKLRVKLSRQLH